MIHRTKHRLLLCVEVKHTAAHVHQKRERTTTILPPDARTADRYRARASQFTTLYIAPAGQRYTPREDYTRILNTNKHVHSSSIIYIHTFIADVDI